MTTRTVVHKPTAVFTVFLLAFFIVVVPTPGFGQAPVIAWQKALGGTGEERVQNFSHTADGGYIVGGVTASKDGDVSGVVGGHDLWVVKLSATGTVQWKKAIGTRQNEEGGLVRPTADGGYIVGGNTVSAKGVRDIVLAKLSATGALLWQKTLGGSADDRLASFELLADGDMILGGETRSNDNQVSGNHGGSDIWVVRLSAAGAVKWQRALGGAGTEFLRTLQAAPDGGFILCGMTYSQELPGYRGASDALIVKLSSSGGVQWQKVLGCTAADQEMFIKPRPAGDYIFALSPYANDGDFAGGHGKNDIWVVQIAADGSIGWKYPFGGSSYEGLSDLQITTDNGILIGGSASSSDGMVTGQHGGGDIWVLRLNATGGLLWQKALGGSKEDQSVAVRPASDGGVVVMGFTNSYDGDVTGSHASATNNAYDTWMVKLSSTGTLQWNRAYGGSSQDWFCNCGTVGYSLWANDEINMRYPATFLSSALLQDASGAFYFATTTMSRDGDVQGLHYSARTGVRTDYWFVKISAGTNSLMVRGEVAPEPEAFTLLHRMYPNPSRGVAQIIFTGAETGPATVDVYAVNGARVKTLFAAPVVAGQSYSIPVKDYGLAPGSYLYVISNGRKRAVGKFYKD